MAQLNVGGNYLAGMTGGLQGGQMIRQMQDQNALRAIMQESGGNMLDPQVIAQVSALDPNMGMQLSNQAYQRERNAAADARAEQQFQMGMRVDQARLEQIKADAAMKAKEYARQADDRTKAETAARIEQGLVRATQLYRQGDLQGLNAMLAEVGEEPIQSLEQFPLVAAAYEGVWEVLSRTEPTETKFMNVDGVAYRVDGNALTPVTEPRDRQPLVQIGMGEGAQGGALSLPEPQTNVPAGSGRNAFGLTGAIANTANAITDFAAGVEAFPEVGENTRFFRNVEEDLLVGLSQAYGRQPAMQLMERLRGLLPNVGTTEGAQSAYRELSEMESRFRRDLASLERQAARNLTESRRQEIEGRIVGIQSALGLIREGQRRLDPNPATGAEIPDEDREYLRSLGLEVD